MVKRLMNNLDFFNFFWENYSDDFDCDFYYKLNGKCNIEGKYKGKNFKLLYEEGRSLIICIAEDGEKLLNDFFPVLCNVINEESSVFQYDYQRADVLGDGPTKVIECNIDNPDDRYRKLKSGEEYIDGFPHVRVRNLSITTINSSIA